MQQKAQQEPRQLQHQGWALAQQQEQAQETAQPQALQQQEEE